MKNKSKKKTITEVSIENIKKSEKKANFISGDNNNENRGDSIIKEENARLKRNGKIIVEEEEEYKANSYTEDISFIELAIINDYLHNCYRFKTNDILVKVYGSVDNVGKLFFGGMFDNTSSYWFLSTVKGFEDNEIIIQTKMYLSNGELITKLHLTTKKAINESNFETLVKNVKKLSFNNSQYKGKCIEVKLNQSQFQGIDIIDLEDSNNNLILNDVQHKFIEHFINRLSRGGSARYLLNGQPGSGKTESIREIARRLVPNVTFIIPNFTTGGDLTTILEACEIFTSGTIIMDDIDLYLGSRDHGNYTKLLGQFLSFFDGVKKRKISLLASTNDKGLVDKAAERPGRFNFTLDYGYLDKNQIIKVCDIHLPELWRKQEVYDALTDKIDGEKAKITGAFIANLANNLKEMSEDDENWGLSDTLSLIKESYKGFYKSQIAQEKQTVGFDLNNK